MKKILNGLLILVVFLVGINGVSALSADTSIIYSKTKDIEITIQNLYTGSSIFKINEYSLNADKHYVAYCLDPHKAASTSYTVDRILGSTGSDIVRAHDYGILEMLKYGYTQINSSYQTSEPTPESNPNPYVATVSGTNLYAATNIAVRAYILGLFGWGGNSINNAYMQRQASAFTYMGAQWAGWNSNAVSLIAGTSCSAGANCQQALINLRQRTYSWFNPNNTLHGWTYGTASYDIVYAAKEIFDKGVEAAVNYLQNGAAQSSVSGKVTNNVQDGAREDDQVQEYIYAELNLTDFSEDAYLNNFNFVCNNCSSAGVVFDGIEYYDASGNWTSLPLQSDMDLSEILTPDEKGLRSGTIRLRIHITKTASEDEDCQNASFEVTYSYYDPNTEYIGAILKDKNRSDMQRMVIIDEVSDTTFNDSFSGTINCVTVVCETQISVPICSDQEDEAISEITTDERIKKCVLDNVDDAGNSYQLTENNGGVDNDYCQVFCKEDYKETIDDGIQGGIKLNPVVEDVECGGFFQLTSHIEGQKDCYTGGDTDDKRIDKEQYIADIVAAQEMMIEGYHLVMMADAADATDYEEHTCTGDCGGCTGVGYTKSGNFTGIQPGNSNDEGYVPVESRNDSFSYGSGPSCRSTCCGGGTKENPCSPGGYCHDGTSRSQVDAQIDATRAEGEQKMADGYEAYVNAIKAYNGCTAAWSNEYQFAQRLQFYYSEYHYEDEYTPYYDIIEAADNEDLYYLEAQEDTLKEESEVVICKGDTDENYECQEATVNFDGSLDLNVDEWNYVSNYGGSVYSQQTYTICDESGCEDSQRMISDATFIRKTVKKSQDYITPTVFYQIEANGKITVNSGYTGNALKLEALINSLPISTSTTGGGIFKLMLEDLGEFYDTGEVGRLIDFNGDNEDSSVAEAKGEVGTFDGEYTCHYYSPCRPEDCPDCDFICDEDECYWDDPGSCPDCVFECINCIFDLDELQLNFKPISTTNFDSAGREFGYNWDISTSLSALQLLKDKAELTIDEIEEANETIYDKTGEDSQLSFSIRMTSDVINYLKEYNDEVEEEGGYANDSLTCYDATIDGKTYSNIFCYSEVIDELVDRYDNQITVNNRTPESGRSDENNKANSNGYWSLWDWTEPSRDANGQYTIIGGPSWK